MTSAVARRLGLEGGAFLIQHANAEAPTDSMPPELIYNSPFPLVTIIAADDASDSFSYAYADARGIHRVYKMSLDDGGWKMRSARTACRAAPG